MHKTEPGLLLWHFQAAPEYAFRGNSQNRYIQMKHMTKAEWWFLLVLLELAVPATIIWLRSAH